MEKCYGCGAETKEAQKVENGEIVTYFEKHPIVGVVNKADVEEGTAVLENPDAESVFVGVLVCKECHENPEHRTAHALKCHFFERTSQKQIRMALILAGSEDIGG